ncbi:MAG: SDR family oxidoreductase [Paracoccaceae bacterium]
MADGYLFIVGRAKDMIIINGKNLWPQDIEWAIDADGLHILQIAQDPRDPDFIVCGTRPGEIFLSEDDGATWTRANLDASTECWFINTSRANFKHSMDISAYSFIEVARRAHPMMCEQGGTLMTLTYQGSNRVVPNYNVMGVAKAALESATRYLANDLGPEGIRVNAISPGPMKTLAGAAIGGARKTYKHTDQNAPLRSNATLEAVGGTAVYLASDAGACTTGEIIRVDGGFHVLGMPQADNL